MQHFIVVNMLQTQRQLHKPVKDLGLWEEFAALFCFLDPSLKVGSFAVVHDHTHVFLLNEAIVVANDIRMIQTFQYLDLMDKREGKSQRQKV